MLAITWECLTYGLVWTGSRATYAQVISIHEYDKQKASAGLARQVGLEYEYRAEGRIVTATQDCWNDTAQYALESGDLTVYVSRTWPSVSILRKPTTLGLVWKVVSRIALMLVLALLAIPLLAFFWGSAWAQWQMAQGKTFEESS